MSIGYWNPTTCCGGRSDRTASGPGPAAAPRSKQSTPPRPGWSTTKGCPSPPCRQSPARRGSDYLARGDATIERCRGRSAVRRRRLCGVLDDEANDAAVLGDDETATVTRPSDGRVEEDFLSVENRCRGWVQHLAALHRDRHFGRHRPSRIAEHVDLIGPFGIAARHATQSP